MKMRDRVAEIRADIYSSVSDLAVAVEGVYKTHREDLLKIIVLGPTQAQQDHLVRQFPEYKYQSVGSQRENLEMGVTA